MATIKDIAKISGFSIGTVSRVINHHSDVNENTRKKIEEVIAQMNFQPNSNARLLKQQAPSPITIFVKGMQNLFLEGILEEVQKLFRQNDEDVVVVFLDETANEVETALHICEERKPKGFLFLGGNIAYFKEQFGQIDVPSVLVTESAASLDFAQLSSFATDDAVASQEAMEFLTRKGHRKIAIVGGEADDQKGEIGYRRYSSSVKYLNDHAISFDSKKQFEPSKFGIKEGYEAASRLLQKNKDITAIYALSDTIALGVMRAIYDAGLRVPQDISMIGFDGLEYTRYAVPRLAAIQQDTNELARRSVEDLLLRINYPKHKTRHELIPYRVLVGESIKDLKE